MRKSDPHPEATSLGGADRRTGRRRFLAQLGLLAGVGAGFPALRWSRLQGKLHRVETARPALGTWVRVVVQDHDPARAARAAERAFEAIRVVDAEMSIHRADSQVSRVNAAAGKGMVPVGGALVAVLARALEEARRTDGLYDPTILPLMRLYGYYGAGHDRYPTDGEIGSALAVTGYRHVALDPGGSRLGLLRQGAGLDLGSIGKGWALDRAVDGLRAEGVHSGLVDVGGNVFGLGAPEESEAGWSVGVLHPATGKMDRIFVLRDAAVATSGNYEQSRLLGHVRVGHLFDARRGRPADGHLSASVMARTGTESDVLSTVAFLMGPDRFRDHPGALESHFIG
ncbi:MAG TPA: FAD:protein FMN transferase [Candidatus Eisenbacteria bacterium]